MKQWSIFWAMNTVFTKENQLFFFAKLEFKNFNWKCRERRFSRNFKYCFRKILLYVSLWEVPHCNYYKNKSWFNLKQLTSTEKLYLHLNLLKKKANFFYSLNLFNKVLLTVSGITHRELWETDKNSLSWIIIKVVKWELSF